jgi:hypothetical protein
MNERDMIRWTAFQLNILVCREIGRVVNVKKENVELHGRRESRHQRLQLGPVHYKITAD